MTAGCNKVQVWGRHRTEHSDHPDRTGHYETVLYQTIFMYYFDGFGGLVVSILATGTRVRGFKRGRSRWIFRVSGKSSVCLPSEGK